jgi:hypothetical protein
VCEEKGQEPLNDLDVSVLAKVIHNTHGQGTLVFGFTFNTRVENFGGFALTPSGVWRINPLPGSSYVLVSLYVRSDARSVPKCFCQARSR